MTTPPAKAPRPPNDRGQGRKPISKSGALTNPHTMSFTDSEWENAGKLATEAGAPHRTAWFRTQIVKGMKALKRKG